MADSGQDKTEDATPRRRSEARLEGNIPKSQDLNAAVMLLAAIVGLQFFGTHVFAAMRSTMLTLLSGAHSANPTRLDDLGALAGYCLRTMLGMLAPLLLVITGVGLVVCVGQVGFVITGKPLVPSLKKLNPIKGIQQLLNLRALVRLLQSLGKFILIGAVATAVMIMDIEEIMHLAELDALPAFVLASRMVFELGIILCGLLMLLAIADFAYQKWQHSQDLKMTKQEVKQEMKNMDGDPLVKQRRARVARQLAMQRTAQAVPGADVIVTNPTHYAIALKYDNGSMQAPKVVAKGADFMAMQIRQIAALHGIPLVERKPLARALYANVEVGQEIPQEHYTAVAEIIAYVYRISGKKAA